MKQINPHPWDSSVHHQSSTGMYTCLPLRSQVGKRILEVYEGFDVRYVLLGEESVMLKAHSFSIYLKYYSKYI